MPRTIKDKTTLTLYLFAKNRLLEADNRELKSFILKLLKDNVDLKEVIEREKNNDVL